MFIAAGDGHAVIKSSDLPQNDAGFVTMLPSCEVKGHPWLYAVGDVAALEGPDWKAKQGHIAEVMARIAANDIARKETGAGQSESYVDDLCILCVMDMGNGAGFVYRDDKTRRLPAHARRRALAQAELGTVLRAHEAGEDPSDPRHVSRR